MSPRVVSRGTGAACTVVGLCVIKTFADLLSYSGPACACIKSWRGGYSVIRGSSRAGAYPNICMFPRRRRGPRATGSWTCRGYEWWKMAAAASPCQGPAWWGQCSLTSGGDCPLPPVSIHTSGAGKGGRSGEGEKKRDRGVLSFQSGGRLGLKRSESRASASSFFLLLFKICCIKSLCSLRATILLHESS